MTSKDKPTRPGGKPAGRDKKPQFAGKKAAAPEAGASRPPKAGPKPAAASSDGRDGTGEHGGAPEGLQGQEAMRIHDVTFARRGWRRSKQVAAGDGAHGLGQGPVASLRWRSKKVKRAVAVAARPEVGGGRDLRKSHQLHGGRS